MENLAETEGFEPSMQFLTACSLSRGVPSTTRPGLRNANFAKGGLYRFRPHCVKSASKTIAYFSSFSRKEYCSAVR